jgi:hypothetical protein
MIQMNADFQEAIKALSGTLKQLLSAAKIVRDRQADTLSDHVTDLAECFLKQFHYITATVSDWHVYVKSGSSAPLSDEFIASITDLALKTEDFTQTTNVLCEKITVLASTKTTRWKRKVAARTQRTEEEELAPDDPLNELPLASSAQVLEALEKLQQAIIKTFQFSVEFGLGKLYWSSQPERDRTTQAGATDMNSDCLPLNPFMVDVEAITVMAVTLRQQVIWRDW